MAAVVTPLWRVAPSPHALQIWCSPNSEHVINPIVSFRASIDDVREEAAAHFTDDLILAGNANILVGGLLKPIISRLSRC